MQKDAVEKNIYTYIYIGGDGPVIMLLIYKYAYNGFKICLKGWVHFSIVFCGEVQVRL
jgi:hypothetical protein